MSNPKYELGETKGFKKGASPAPEKVPRQMKKKITVTAGKIK
jgi:hypothetical protein